MSIHNAQGKLPWTYRKPTHTDRYLQRNLNHHPCHTFEMIEILSGRAKKICEPDKLNNEVGSLKANLVANGYTKYELDNICNQKVTKVNSRNHQY